ncbi:hypothetical protein RRG08_007177 [Elysia crispata]|uniref:Uncharacterized protein n=1 Tax=Elysia crispata TaxID=231223 RepID=A0AAE1B2U0_9GAST|nr:hypothetical protein RRG08_007177 [Elysia crispata]
MHHNRIVLALDPSGGAAYGVGDRSTARDSAWCSEPTINRQRNLISISGESLLLVLFSGNLGEWRRFLFIVQEKRGPKRELFLYGSVRRGLGWK